MKATVVLLDILTFIGAVIGGLMLFAALTSAEASAPQQGSLAAMAVALVVIPYCLSAMLHRSIMRSLLSNQPVEYPSARREHSTPSEPQSSPRRPAPSLAD